MTSEAVGFQPLACPKCGRAIMSRQKWKSHAPKCGIQYPFEPEVLEQAEQAYVKLYGKSKPTKPRIQASDMKPSKTLEDEEENEKEETEDTEDEEDNEDEEEEAKPAKKRDPWICGKCNANLGYGKEQPTKCNKCGAEF